MDILAAGLSEVVSRQDDIPSSSTNSDFLFILLHQAQDIKDGQDHRLMEARMLHGIKQLAEFEWECL